MEKIENKEVEQYIKKDIASILESCEIFTKVYGKGFAKKRLNQNLKKVYTNQFDSVLGGYLNSTKGELIICTKNTNDSTLIEKVLNLKVKLRKLKYNRNQIQTYNKNKMKVDKNQ